MRRHDDEVRIDFPSALANHVDCRAAKYAVRYRNGRARNELLNDGVEISLLVAPLLRVPRNVVVRGEWQRLVHQGDVDRRVRGTSERCRAPQRLLRERRSIERDENLSEHWAPPRRAMVPTNVTRRHGRSSRRSSYIVAEDRRLVRRRDGAA